MLGVIAVHGLFLVALMQERQALVHPEAVTMVSLIDGSRRERVQDPPKPPQVTPVSARLVFDAPPFPTLVYELVPTESTPSAPVQISVEHSGAVALGDELSVFCPTRSSPAYPSQSRHLREQGEVTLRVELDERGMVGEVNVIKSSGYTRLDAAARAAVQTWHCQPAMRDGQPTRAVAIQSLAFVLERR